MSNYIPSTEVNFSCMYEVILNTEIFRIDTCIAKDLFLGLTKYTRLGTKGVYGLSLRLPHQILGQPKFWSRLCVPKSWPTLAKKMKQSWKGATGMAKKLATIQTKTKVLVIAKKLVYWLQTKQYKSIYEAEKQRLQKQGRV